jgi:hypothetical protein
LVVEVADPEKPIKVARAREAEVEPKPERRVLVSVYCSFDTSIIK